jgi:hypothetical protein
MDGWTFAWIMWAAMFCAIEGAALCVRHPGATLSEHLRAIFSTRWKSNGWWWRRLALVCSLAGLLVHLMW